jgi:polysaccharide export outer membrane protein
MACKRYNNARGLFILKVLARFRGPRYVVPCIAVVLFFHSTSRSAAQDVSVVGTQQQTNDKIRSLGETYKASPHEYTIGNGDLLSISVFDVPELTKELRVSQNGTISMPLVPTRLHVAGLTEIQAEQLLADVLEANGLVTHAEVGVTVKEHRSRPITVVGAIQHPMVYEADHSVTLLEVLAEAGGVSADAGDTVIVTRMHAATFIPVPTPAPLAEPAPGAAGSEGTAPSSNTAAPGAEPNTQAPSGEAVSAAAKDQNAAPASDTTGAPPGNLITINLNDLLETGDTKNNITLQAGDVVTVPHAGIVYVLGAVNKPGGYVLANDRSQLTTMKVLSLAGGNTRTAKMDHAVIVRKDAQGKQTQTEVDLSKVLKLQAEDLQMRASDVLYIPENKAKAVLIQAVQISLAVGTAIAIYRLAYH